jgi:pimeloyl-ACP methyl ester carboxylesterase
VSTPKALQLPSGVRRLTIETSRGKFAALEALPPSGVRERQPALLVPGYTGSKEDFLLILQALAAAGRQVVAIDMRGQFETPGADDADAYQLGELAADVAMVADWLSEGYDSAAGGDGRGDGWGVHLLGHSLGGLVTREVLLAQAARISSLTLMSSGPGALSGPRARILQELLAELDSPGPAGLGADAQGTVTDGTVTGGIDRRDPDRLAAEVERIWRTRLRPEAVAGGVPAPIIDFLGTRLLSSSPTGLRAMAETLLTCPDQTPALAQLDAVPLMVLYGENDDAWDPAAQEDMAARLRAQRICIPAAAHSPAVEAPETTASTLTSFWNATECRQARPSRSA